MTREHRADEHGIVMGGIYRGPHRSRSEPTGYILRRVVGYRIVATKMWNGWRDVRRVQTVRVGGPKSGERNHDWAVRPFLDSHTYWK